MLSFALKGHFHTTLCEKTEGKSGKEASIV
jgi:hypothetical protein